MEDNRNNNRERQTRAEMAGGRNSNPRVNNNANTNTTTGSGFNSMNSQSFNGTGGGHIPTGMPNFNNFGNNTSMPNNNYNNYNNIPNNSGTDANSTQNQSNSSNNDKKSTYVPPTIGGVGGTANNTPNSTGGHNAGRPTVNYTNPNQNSTGAESKPYNNHGSRSTNAENTNEEKTHEYDAANGYARGNFGSDINNQIYQATGGRFCLPGYIGHGGSGLGNIAMALGSYSTSGFRTSDNAIYDVKMRVEKAASISHIVGGNFELKKAAVAYKKITSDGDMMRAIGAYSDTKGAVAALNKASGNEAGGFIDCATGAILDKKSTDAITMKALEQLRTTGVCDITVKGADGKTSVIKAKLAGSTEETMGILKRATEADALNNRFKLVTNPREQAKLLSEVRSRQLNCLQNVAPGFNGKKLNGKQLEALKNIKIGDSDDNKGITALDVYNSYMKSGKVANYSDDRARGVRYLTAGIVGRDFQQGMDFYRTGYRVAKQSVKITTYAAKKALATSMGLGGGVTGLIAKKTGNKTMENIAGSLNKSKDIVNRNAKGMYNNAKEYKKQVRAERLEKRNRKRQQRADRKQVLEMRKVKNGLTAKEHKELKRLRRAERHTKKIQSINKYIKAPVKKVKELKAAIQASKLVTFTGKIAMIVEGIINIPKMIINKLKKYALIGLGSFLLGMTVLGALIGVVANLGSWLSSSVADAVETDFVGMLEDINYNQLIVDHVTDFLIEEYNDVASRDAQKHYLTKESVKSPYGYNWSCDVVDGEIRGVYDSTEARFNKEGLPALSVGVEGNIVPILSAMHYRYTEEFNFNTYTTGVAYMYYMYVMTHHAGKEAADYLNTTSPLGSHYEEDEFYSWEYGDRHDDSDLYKNTNLPKYKPADDKRDTPEVKRGDGLFKSKQICSNIYVHGYKQGLSKKMNKARGIMGGWLNKSVGNLVDAGKIASDVLGVDNYLSDEDKKALDDLTDSVETAAEQNALASQGIVKSYSSKGAYASMVPAKYLDAKLDDSVNKEGNRLKDENGNYIDICNNYTAYQYGTRDVDLSNEKYQSGGLNLYADTEDISSLKIINKRVWGETNGEEGTVKRVDSSIDADILNKKVKAQYDVTKSQTFEKKVTVNCVDITKKGGTSSQNFYKYDGVVTGVSGVDYEFDENGNSDFYEKLTLKDTTQLAFAYKGVKDAGDKETSQWQFLKNTTATEKTQFYIIQKNMTGFDSSDVDTVCGLSGYKRDANSTDYIKYRKKELKLGYTETITYSSNSNGYWVKSYRIDIDKYFKDKYGTNVKLQYAYSPSNGTATGDQQFGVAAFTVNSAGTACASITNIPSGWGIDYVNISTEDGDGEFLFDNEEIYKPLDIDELQSSQKQSNIDTSSFLGETGLVTERTSFSCGSDKYTQASKIAHYYWVVTSNWEPVKDNSGHIAYTDGYTWNYSHEHKAWESEDKPGCFYTALVCNGHCAGHVKPTIDVYMDYDWEQILNKDNFKTVKYVTESELMDANSPAKVVAFGVNSLLGTSFFKPDTLTEWRDYWTVKMLTWYIPFPRGPIAWAETISKAITANGAKVIDAATGSIANWLRGDEAGPDDYQESIANANDNPQEVDLNDGTGDKGDTATDIYHFTSWFGEDIDKNGNPYRIDDIIEQDMTILWGNKSNNYDVGRQNWEDVDVHIGGGYANMLTETQKAMIRAQLTATYGNKIGEQQWAVINEAMDKVGCFGYSMLQHTTDPDRTSGENDCSGFVGSTLNRVLERNYTGSPSAKGDDAFYWCASMYHQHGEPWSTPSSATTNHKKDQLLPGDIIASNVSGVSPTSGLTYSGHTMIYIGYLSEGIAPAYEGIVKDTTRIIEDPGYYVIDCCSAYGGTSIRPLQLGTLSKTFNKMYKYYDPSYDQP